MFTIYFSFWKKIEKKQLRKEEVLVPWTWEVNTYKRQVAAWGIVENQN